MKPPAIGYVRADISGVTQPWHEKEIRSLATKLGYDYGKTIVFNERTIDPIMRLGRVISPKDLPITDAVVVPSLEHLGGEVPRGLLMLADVIVLSPFVHHTRELTGPPDPLFPTMLRGGEITDGQH